MRYENVVYLFVRTKNKYNIQRFKNQDDLIELFNQRSHIGFIQYKYVFESNSVDSIRECRAVPQSKR